MLSNPALHLVGMFSIVPVERLVVDEASQIKVEDFMVRIPWYLIQPSLTIQQHIFVKFSKTLRKVSFFGDPKQRQEIILILSTPESDAWISSSSSAVRTGYGPRDEDHL